ncbi:TRAP transporter large permease [Photobacterium sanctipauli]|uniref:TRAP transporter large permease protein n=1 Tax=Photobacterium sanctipauli TaxID=1342794 RepID=A0A2T3P141_9GAMM|nr:TRAP transporter large permease [Photobacterium sanctipauli]PSW22220.1 TRAP transporter large permease [Photobacterium sanctipauli]
MFSLAVLSFFLILGIPLVFAIIMSMTLYLGETPISISLIGQRIFGGLDSFSILAIPLFVLAGELMNKSGITNRIITFANSLVGAFRGGLAQVNVWSSVMFAGLSGSAVADTSALGRVFIPEMEKEGYSREFSSALTAASSVIGPMIPPSIPVIIYALIASGVSVPALFLAGIVPGVLSAVCLSVFVYIYASRNKNIKCNTAKQSLKERFNAFISAIVPLTMPVFIIGAILMGIVTPTEAAAFAAFYALIIGMFIFRTLKIKDLPEVFITSMRDSSIVLILIAVVSVANWLLTFSQVPQMISQQVLDNITNPIVFLLLVNLILLAVGLFLEGIAAMLILIPILHPIAMSFGIDPVHFGVIVIFNLMIGLITPPMGMCLFVANTISKVGIAAISRQVIPLFLLEVLVLMFITFVPSSVLMLPRLFGY